MADPLADREFERVRGMAVFGVGLLSLPAAEVCSERSTSNCTRGDISLMLEGWQLFRPWKRLAFGAGITLGLFPASDASRSDPPGIERSHKRSYFTGEGTARFYLWSQPTFEGWLGITGGLVAVSDTFSSKSSNDGKAFVGPRGVTIRTEGFTAGLAAGIDYSLSSHFTLGGALRYGLWNLPSHPAKDPFQDEASLSGRVSTFVLGVTLGYRVSL